MIFQHFNLMSQKDSRENVALHLNILGSARKKKKAKAAVVGLVGLWTVPKTTFTTIWRAKQRVAIARALAMISQNLISDGPL